MTRDQFIEALSFPRKFVRDNMDLIDCKHAGNFANEDATCIHCDQGSECEWLYSNDEFIALADKPVEEHAGALEFALGFVEAQVSFWNHKRSKCPCEACNWLRDTQRLFDEFMETDWRSIASAAHKH